MSTLNDQLLNQGGRISGGINVQNPINNDLIYIPQSNPVILGNQNTSSIIKNSLIKNKQYATQTGGENATLTIYTPINNLNNNKVNVIDSVNPPSDFLHLQTILDDRIVGGENVISRSYPWMTSLQSSFGRHYCGAALIHPSWVLSAKHCTVSTSDIRNIKVKIGGININNTSEFLTRNVVRKIEHSNFDIVIMELDRPVTDVPFIRLNGNNNLVPGQLTKALGWGLLEEGSGLLPNVLQQVQLPLVSDQDCQVAYPSEFNSTFEICAGFDLGGKDACQGDSGGPLLIERGDDSVNEQTLIGATSWGDGCARPGKYGVWARISTSLPWIQEYIPDIKAYDAETGLEMEIYKDGSSTGETVTDTDDVVIEEIDIIVPDTDKPFTLSIFNKLSPGQSVLIFITVMFIFHSSCTLIQVNIYFQIVFIFLE